MTNKDIEVLANQLQRTLSVGMWIAAAALVIAWWRPDVAMVYAVVGGTWAVVSTALTIFAGTQARKAP